MLQFVDVAEALKRLMDAELSSVGQTYNLAGPKTFTHAEFLAFIRAYTLDPKHLTEAAIPKPLLKLFATLTNKFLWWPTMDADFVERQNIDERTDTQIRHLRDGSLSVAESWDRVGIEPDTMEEHALKCESFAYTVQGCQLMGLFSLSTHRPQDAPQALPLHQRGLHDVDVRQEARAVPRHPVERGARPPFVLVIPLPLLSFSSSLLLDPKKTRKRCVSMTLPRPRKDREIDEQAYRQETTERRRALDPLATRLPAIRLAERSTG